VEIAILSEKENSVNKPIEKTTMAMEKDKFCDTAGASRIGDRGRGAARSASSSSGEGQGRNVLTGSPLGTATVILSRVDSDMVKKKASEVENGEAVSQVCITTNRDDESNDESRVVDHGPFGIPSLAENRGIPEYSHLVEEGFTPIPRVLPRVWRVCEGNYTRDE